LLEPQAGAGRTLGHLIDLRRFGDGTAYLTHGWSSPDEAGSATRGLLSQLTLPVDRAEPPAQLFLIARPRFAPDEEEFWVDLLIDGTARTRWLFSRSAPSNRWLTAPIGPNPAKTLNIALVIGSRDPSESGAGLTIETISLKPPL
jgi:hypothetical protein